MRNDYEIRGEVTAIILESDRFGTKETVINTSKLDVVRELPIRWYPLYNKKTDSFYAIGNCTSSTGIRKLYRIHRLVCGQPDRMFVDHINHDTLDNTDSNLRILTNAENMQNRKGSNSKSVSGVRGVTWVKNRDRWWVRIVLNGKTYSFGYHRTIEEAEKIAREVRIKHMPFTIES